ncbi:hypothetical protein PITC_013900 [Penicillium italicum]|uniref:Uncharacterized protein n=1 Tax=Penicillium italicum TaxID=40296 RepID=A0A0A2KE22_PENIT|nr:hypothetical protein PITC_013900 [Penicillium italicum]
MLELSRGLRPAEGYEAEEHRWAGDPRSLKYGNKLVNIKIFVDVIANDYLLREIVQREEFIKRKFCALENTTNNEDKGTPLHPYDTELQHLRARYRTTERTLYFAESMIPLGPLQRSYDFLRQDPAWYLRRELIQDCARSGACCSRGCGCCKNRLSTSERGKGIGHCTTWCFLLLDRARF